MKATNTDTKRNEQAASLALAEVGLTIEQLSLADAESPEGGDIHLSCSQADCFVTTNEFDLYSSTPVATRPIK